MKVVLTTLNAKYIHSSLALRYLYAYCKESNSDILIKEYTINNSLLEILNDIFIERPDVVGLACYIWNIDMILEIVGLLKKVLPNAVIILGGPEVTYGAKAILNQNNDVNFIIRGEGEESFYKLLKALKLGRDASGIPGVVSRRTSPIEEVSQVINNLDQIPFPYMDSDIDTLQDRIIYYESSRGCPFACQYCLSSATTGVRFFSVSRAINDLKFFIAHDVKQVKFVDRTFNARKEHFFPILQFLAKQEGRTNFHFEIAADILDDEVLEFLRDVPIGKFQFEVGIQSTHVPTLMEIQRVNHWERLTSVVKKLLSYKNIHIHLDLIVGLPKETYTTFGESFNNVYNLKPQMLQIGFLKLLKGSGMRETADKHGYVYMDHAPYQILSNNYMSYEEIRKLAILEDVFNLFYNSGRFSYSMTLFTHLFKGNAFAFYSDFSQYWEERKLHLIAHSAKKLYEYILLYCESRFPEIYEDCREFLKFDALVNGQGAVKSDILLWNEEKWNIETTNFWRNEDIVRKYIPDYAFTTWRDLKKKYHIEVFAVDVVDYWNSDNHQDMKIPVLFCFQNGTEYKIIETRDFW